MRRFTGESKAPVVERDDAIPRGDEWRQRETPRVQRCADAVDENDGRAIPGINDAQAGAIDGSILSAERRPRGVTLVRGNRRGPARGSQREQGQCGACPHEMVCKARRPIITMRGWELHNPAIASPSPDVKTSCDSSMMSSVTFGASSGACLSHEGASAGR